MKLIAPFVALIAFVSVVTSAVASAESVSSGCPADNSPIEIELSHSDGRDMRANMWAPDTPGRFPLIVFSHGAFSSPAKYQALLASWADAGYIVLAPLHIDSEVITGGTPPDREITWHTRMEDFALLLDQPTEINSALNSENIKIEGDKMVAAGHSYGALIAQLFAGAKARSAPKTKPLSYLDPRVAAVIALSPPGPMEGMIDESAWDELRLPQLVVTGTADVLPGFIDDWQLHRWSYDRAKGKPSWLWVGDGVDHYFGNLIGRTERSAKPQSAAFDDAVSSSIEFLDAILPSTKAPSCKPQLHPSAVTIFEKK